MSRDELVQVLRCAGGEGLHKRSICCPFHDDETPSAEIKQAASGRYYFYCHRCDISDDVWDLQARVEGRDVGDILREARFAFNDAQSSQQTEKPPWVAPAPKNGSAGQQTQKNGIFATIEQLIDVVYRRKFPEMILEEVNPYFDPQTGEIDIYSIRYRATPSSKKTIAQATPCDGGYVPKGLAGDSPTPMFNRLGARLASRILVVEGEKCVRAVNDLGIPGLAAVSSLGGSSNGHRCDWSPLTGGDRRVYFWADNDEPGKQYREAVLAKLKELNPPPKLYRIREEELELGPGGDVYDYLAEAGDSREEKIAALEIVLLDAESLGASASLAEHFQRVAEGRYFLVPFINKKHLTSGTQAYLPGTVTVIAGAPEAGKSWFVLEEAWRQHEAGVSTRILMLEDNHAFHMRRYLAQMSGEPLLLDHTHTETNIKWAQSLYDRYQDRLDSFGQVLEAPGSEERSIFQVAEWVERCAQSGVRLIIVDPITAASTSEISWQDDRKFMMRAKLAAERHDCSVVLVTHPKLGQAGRPSLSGLAGGAAYSRFSQTVLWLEKFPEMQTGNIGNGFQSQELDYQRAIRIHKARNGKEAGKNTSRTIAVQLNPQNLCFIELGMIL